jgi:hypothetical protein
MEEFRSTINLGISRWRKSELSVFRTKMLNMNILKYYFDLKNGFSNGSKTVVFSVIIWRRDAPKLKDMEKLMKHTQK